jgi:hypothetical protein
MDEHAVGYAEEVTMADEPTCGQGLARHALLPQLIGELMESVADNLSAHLLALASSDANSQREKRVYDQLAASHREAAATLQAIGTEMAAQQNLPMGEHDVSAMSPSEASDALERVIRAETQLVAHLQRQLSEHQAILDAMGS